MDEIEKDKMQIMNLYFSDFVNNDYTRSNGDNSEISLIWCNFKNQYGNTFPIAELHSKLSPEKTVYFYDDRSDLLYKSDFLEVCNYIESLEPWEETDAVIFDESMKWTIAVTHEDFIIVIGLNN